jgi:hypothetical protein
MAGMKLAPLTALLIVLSGCHKEEGPSAGGTAAVSAGGASASFFSGPMPASVKMKPFKGAAFGEGGRALVFQIPDGWVGGVLPGYDYMANNKDASVVFRAFTANGVTGGMTCKDLATTAKMAPLKASDVADKAPPVPAKAGAKAFDAREGTCTATTAKGPIEIHYLDLLIGKDPADAWHYAVTVALPVAATLEQRDHAMAVARSLELNGRNQYKP